MEGVYPHPSELVSNRSDPLLADSDGDGLLDPEEYARGTNPKYDDSDDDRLNDAAEVRINRTDRTPMATFTSTEMRWPTGAPRR